MLRNWLASLFRFPAIDAPSDTAHGAMRAAPMVLNPDNDDRVRISLYRLDAIRRHIEQATKPISPQRMREFREETEDRARALLRAGKISQYQHDEALALVAGP
jgi:hypothetical protein